MVEIPGILWWCSHHCSICIPFFCFIVPLMWYLKISREQHCFVMIWCTQSQQAHHWVVFLPLTVSIYSSPQAGQHLCHPSAGSLQKKKIVCVHAFWTSFLMCLAGTWLCAGCCSVEHRLRAPLGSVESWPFAVMWWWRVDEVPLKRNVFTDNSSYTGVITVPKGLIA